MIASQALLALILATNITPVETSQGVALVQNQVYASFSSEKSTKEITRKITYDFLLPFKEGYIKEEDLQNKKKTPPEKQDFKRRKCHQDVNFYGRKERRVVPYLRARGKK